MNKAVFFDRDGVINRRIFGGYVTKWEEFELLSDVAAVLTAVKEKGYLAIVITNQRGIGKGLMTEADLSSIHRQLQDHLQTTTLLQFDDILYCPDADRSSPRRKPSPAMLLEAGAKWNIDLSQSWIIGDSLSDIEAGRRAGTHTAFLITEHTTEIPEADVILQKLTDFLPVLN
jgi:D-glycero-D-manno-heptose 1,7-bisphosphate phosphatase